MKLKLIEKRFETADITSFIFKPDTDLKWQAGQFLHYNLPDKNPDNRKTERFFTIAAAPFEKNVMVTTRFAEKSSSFKKDLFSLPIGGEINASGPMGSFVVEDPAKEFVFIAGGIGITPFRSILLDLDNKEVPIRGKLLYANRDNNFVFKKELDALAQKHKDFKIRYFVDPEKIDEAAIKQEAPDLKSPIFYVSGPEPMVEAFEKILAGIGVPNSHIKRDYFPGYDWP